MAEFLLELLSEEIPARMQAKAGDDLAKTLGRLLTERRLEPEAVEPISGPRRLGAAVRGLPATQPDLREERKGPRTNAPDKAIRGFLHKNGLRSIESCEVRQDKKGSYYAAVIEQAGAPTPEVLQHVVGEAVAGFTWPKSMRWSGFALRWVRPLHAVVAVFDGKPLGGGLDLGRPGGREPGFAPRAPRGDAAAFLPFAAVTQGHRFLAPGPVTVTGSGDYASQLAQAYVVADRQARLDSVEAQARAAAERVGQSLKPDEALVAENAGMAEWPQALAGRIEADFMSLPDEVLATSMKVNQKYFATLDEAGRLAPYFVVVADGEPADGGEAVVAGNERVLRARLADARFFWDNDRKVPLADRAAALDGVTFHAKLGTMADKARRLRDLAGALAAVVEGAGADKAGRAAELCKADLLSDMVDEFPELQGIMGGYYAREQGYDAELAQAIADHYRPQGPAEACPDRPVSIVVALADKLDTLLGFFAIGEPPTGSKDPYGLRRAALGIIRLVCENHVRVPLRAIMTAAPLAVAADREQLADELIGFMTERMKVVLRSEGVRHDLIDAVYALGREDDLVRLLNRVTALTALLQSQAGSDLLTAYRRAANILRAESRKDGKPIPGNPDRELLAEGPELELFDALAAAEQETAVSLGLESFDEAMAALARLREPVDRFFDQVTVNADDPQLRANRLRLLMRMVATMNQVADFSQVSG